MDAIHLGCVLVMLTQACVRAMPICSIPEFMVDIPENNDVGQVVLTITMLDNVVATFRDPPLNNPFIIDGNQLKANEILDSEVQDFYSLTVNCVQESTGTQLPLPTLFIRVSNVNDNAPTFGQDQFTLDVSEGSLIDSEVGRFAATDKDKPPRLYYTLISETNYFRLAGPNQPNIVVNSVLDYEKVKNVRLVLTAQDTPLGEEDSMTGTTTIMVTISDYDNRPPWFQPCDKITLPGTVICLGEGYTGDLVLGEMKEGVLPLNPGPLHAIDGDSGINGAVTYTILSGNDGNLFQINPNSGNISLLNPVNLLGPIRLTVLAAQVVNPHMTSTTTVTFDVEVKSGNPPRFQKPEYKGVVSATGVMATDPTNSNQPLKIIALDDDYVAVGGINPDIIYQVIGSEDFTITDSFLFMEKLLPDSILSLQVRAVDTVTNEEDVALLTVQVKTGLTTTTVDRITTVEGGVTSNKPGPTTVGGVTTDKPGLTPDGGDTTNKPGSTPDGGVPTNKPGSTPVGGVTTNKPGPTPDGAVTTNKPGPTPDGGVTTNKPGPTPDGGVSTNKPIPTPDGGVTTNKPGPTPDGGVTTNKPGPTPDGGVSTNKPGPTPDGGVSTNKPGPTPDGGVSTNKPGPTPDGTNTPGPTPGGGVSNNTPGPIPTKPDTEKGPVYGPGDMAAVGATLGALLLIALVVIGVLVCRIQKRKTEWSKIYEAIVFKGALTPGSGKEKGMQFTNQTFQHDEERASDGGTIKNSMRFSEEPQNSNADIPHNEASVPLHELLDATSSQNDTENVEKEVKPILTKEKRVDDGYKAVWFKTDIDPSANEEVVIIPDTREDTEDRTSISSREEDPSPRNSPRVGFADSDHDSGLGVRIEDLGDSRDDTMLIDSL